MVHRAIVDAFAFHCWVDSKDLLQKFVYLNPPSAARLDLALVLETLFAFVFEFEFDLLMR